MRAMRKGTCAQAPSATSVDKMAYVKCVASLHCVRVRAGRKRQVWIGFIQAIKLFYILSAPGGCGFESQTLEDKQILSPSHKVIRVIVSPEQEIGTDCEKMHYCMTLVLCQYCNEVTTALCKEFEL